MLFTVTAQGETCDVTVASNDAADEELAQAAREAIRQWRFAPAHLRGEPVAAKEVEAFFEFRTPPDPDYPSKTLAPCSTGEAQRAAVIASDFAWRARRLRA